MPVTELEVNGKTLPCHIQYKRIRHAYLRIKPDLHLEISLPRNNTITAESILAEKRRWLEKKVKELSCIRKIFKEGTMLFRGDYLKVEMRMAEQPYTSVLFNKKSIIVYGKPGQKNDKLLADFVAGQTLAHVRQRAEEFARELGVSYSSIATKETKSWGYCTRQGKLFFNWRLVCLPERLADFIVLHELAHLKHFNHSKRFKNILAKHFADYKELESLLKTYSAR
jgi:predicted metal-dependent hydrolase